MLFSFIAIFLYYLIGLWMYKTEKKYFLYMAFIYVSQLWVIMSCAYIETGIFITEQDANSFWTGATLSLVSFNMVFFIFYFFMIRFLSKREKVEDDSGKPELSNIVRKFFLVIILLSNILLFINIFVSGIPLFSNGTINKFSFWREYAVYPEFNRFLAYSSFYGFILGFIYCNSKEKLYKYGSIFILLLYLFYEVLEGHKFSLQLAMIIPFFIPFIAKIRFTKIFKVNYKWVVVIIISIALVLGLASFQATFRHENFSDILYRIFGLQGHVWWGTDLLVRNSKVDYHNHALQEFSEIFQPSKVPGDTGIHFLTILLGGRLGYDFVVNKGGAFTMGYPAIAIYSFGPFGAVLAQIFFGILSAFLIFVLHRHIKAGHLFRALILFRLLWSFYNVLTMGVFQDLFSSKNLIMFFIFVFLTMVDKLSKAGANTVNCS
jgi:hypothetical protein